MHMGKGGEQDFGKAYHWYRISECSGDVLGHPHAALLRKRLNDEERERAEWRIDSVITSAFTSCGAIPYPCAQLFETLSGQSPSSSGAAQGCRKPGRTTHLPMCD